MSLILNIDTALDQATVSLAESGEIIALLSNEKQQNHAAWLHPAIEELMRKTKKSLHDTAAIAVTEGPGSYTGLRVGMSAAKGICYALQKPLILVNTLEALALQAINQHSTKNSQPIFIPMIDARRMEVYTAAYDKNLRTILPPMAMILQEDSFEKIANASSIVLIGNGSAKFANICRRNNVEFLEGPNSIYKTVAQLADRNFSTKKFSDLMLAEPCYIKPFFTNK